MGHEAPKVGPFMQQPELPDHNIPTRSASSENAVPPMNQFAKLFPLLKNFDGDIGDWKDISFELYRTYNFPDGEVRVDNPVAILIKRNPTTGLDSHRVVAIDEENCYYSVYVRAGWLSIRWVNNHGVGPIQF